MKREEMEYLIKPDGKVLIKVKGIKGSDCLKASAPIEEKLGEVTEHEKTQEYYEEPPRETIITYTG
jgi:hypothetical protein